MTGLANYYRDRQAAGFVEAEQNPIGLDAKQKKTSVIDDTKDNQTLQTLHEDSTSDSIRFSLIDVEGESENMRHSLMSLGSQHESVKDSKEDGSGNEKDARTLSSANENSYKDIFQNSAFSKQVSSNALTDQEASEDSTFKVKDKRPLPNWLHNGLEKVKSLKIKGRKAWFSSRQ